MLTFVLMSKNKTANIHKTYYLTQRLPNRYRLCFT